MHGSIPPAGQARRKRAGPAVFFWRGPLFVAVLAGTAVLATLDPGGSYPRLGSGPGVTLDEVFNVQMGVYQWRAVREHGLKLWSPPVREQVFADGPGGPYNPDHPPLGRVWIGACHDAARTLAPPRETGALTVTACARTASALLFAATVFLTGLCAGRWYGAAAAWSASLSLALMPRVFAHAHLASLETGVGLAFAATVFFVADRFGRPDERLSNRSLGIGALIAGGLWGLALLTKIQAVLAPVPIAIWLLWRLRTRGVAAILVMGLTGAAVFLVGWPWLWIDPIAHVREYFLRGVERATVHCYYFGAQYADVDVPRHYSLVIFAVTVPIGLHGLAVYGTASRLRRGPDSQHAPMRASRDRTLLLAGTVLFVLGFFALPGIPVYDGARLFLVASPLWAVLAGAGAGRLIERLSVRRPPRAAAGVVAVVLACQAYGLIAAHPCQLSYYNLLIGGLPGADRCGMELSYWADGVTRRLLIDAADQTPEGATIDLAPCLIPGQAAELLLQSPVLAEKRIRLRAYDDKAGRDVRYVIVYRRRADPWDSLEPAPQNGRLLSEVRRRGVQLAALYELPASAKARDGRLDREDAGSGRSAE